MYQCGNVSSFSYADVWLHQSVGDHQYATVKKILAESLPASKPRNRNRSEHGSFESITGITESFSDNYCYKKGQAMD